MHKQFLTIAALLGALSVALGAFGAHALKQVLDAQSLATFETAVRYQFYHTMALALVGVLTKDFPAAAVRYAGYCFIAGIIIFSGSLYLLVSLPQYRWLGAITPLGGVSFIVGWIMLAVGVSRK